MISNSPERISALTLGVCKIVTVAAGRCFDSVWYNLEQKNLCCKEFTN